jgi:hypothetical protein
MEDIKKQSLEAQLLTAQAMSKSACPMAALQTSCMIEIACSNETTETSPEVFPKLVLARHALYNMQP